MTARGAGNARLEAQREAVEGMAPGRRVACTTGLPRDRVRIRMEDSDSEQYEDCEAALLAVYDSERIRCGTVEPADGLPEDMDWDGLTRCVLRCLYRLAADRLESPGAYLRLMAREVVEDERGRWPSGGEPREES